MRAGSWTRSNWEDLGTAHTKAYNSHALHWGRRRVSFRSLRRWLITLSVFASVMVYLRWYPEAEMPGEGFATSSWPRPRALLGWRHSETSDGRWLSDNDGLEPSFTTDPNGLRFPPEVYPALMNPYQRANATFVSFVREHDLSEMMLSMRTVEDRINRKFGYPWVFLSEKPFSPDFTLAIKSMTRSQVFFGLIPSRQRTYPSHIDRRRATRAQKAMGSSKKTSHSDDQSHRHISHFHSGHFFRHPLLLDFNYYWRVEPGTQYDCDMDYDPFLFMEENKKVYSFAVSLKEHQSAIPTLWETVQKFARANPDLLPANSSIDFILKDPSQGIESDYNLCHFWSNFELADMRFWRSSAYAKFFAYLDRAGGIYYEGWDEGAIHSIAAVLFLRREQIHQWDDIGYFHSPFSHCPFDYERFHSNGKCFCDPYENFDEDPNSCAPLWSELDRKRNEGLETQAA
ncbi:hypothetical protein MJO29_012919 [Puccinia striiformis f. sp. tritici]|nr:hypothetical protein Pst134EB_025049 [Puccinia striiformis f. sp. tritici]KAI7943075.1 hypothetical protein MJO29_012919 [Puccinia striiformis f. sp. tritici]